MQAEVQDTVKTAHNHLTLLFLYGLGCRVSELISLNITDFNATDRLGESFGWGQ